MKTAKKKQLESKGWKVGSTSEFLNLSPEELKYIDLEITSNKNPRKTHRKKADAENS